MTTLYLTEQHIFVRKRGEILLVQHPQPKNGDKVPATSLPLAQVTEVICFGDISWSGAALTELAEEGISVIYLDWRGRWVSRWEPAEAKTVPLRRAQFRAADDSVRSVEIARQFVAGKLRNSRALILRATRDGMLDDKGEAEALQTLTDRVVKADNIGLVRGLEGDGAATYFQAYGRLVSVNGFTFGVRARRPPPDPINAMLSFGYALLTATAVAAVRTVGFDAHVGYLHADRYGRESLALDLVEEFRAFVVDALVSALIHRRVIKPDDFESEPTESRLSAPARRLFIEQFERKLASEVVHPVLRQKVTHRRAIELQARVLAKHLLGELPAYVPFSKR